MKTTSTVNVSLTVRESAFLKHVAATCGNGYPNYEQAQYLLADNYSWFEAKDLINDQYNRNEVGGYLSSLEDKGLIAEEDPWTLTELGAKYVAKVLYVATYEGNAYRVVDGAIESAAIMADGSIDEDWGEVTAMDMAAGDYLKDQGFPAGPVNFQGR